MMMNCSIRKTNLGWRKRNENHNRSQQKALRRPWSPKDGNNEARWKSNGREEFPGEEEGMNESTEFVIAIMMLFVMTLLAESAIFGLLAVQPTADKLATKACIEQYGEGYDGSVSQNTGSIICNSNGKKTHYDETDIPILIGNSSPERGLHPISCSNGERHSGSNRRGA
jgi:hypothetical protein